jgi:hypothetical protein
MGNKDETDFPKLSGPARRALAGAGYSRLEQLTHATEAELTKLHGMGPTAIDALRTALRERALASTHGQSAVRAYGSQSAPTTTPAGLSLLAARSYDHSAELLRLRTGSALLSRAAEGAGRFLAPIPVGLLR